jgi:hypothetical protein
MRSDGPQSEVEADNVEKLALKAMLGKILSRRRLEEFSSLVAAAKDGDVDMVRTLLTRGADVNMTDYDGRSALAMVSMLGALNMKLRLLLID